MKIKGFFKVILLKIILIESKRISLLGDKLELALFQQRLYKLLIIGETFQSRSRTGKSCLLKLAFHNL